MKTLILILVIIIIPISTNAQSVMFQAGLTIPDSERRETFGNSYNANITGFYGQPNDNYNFMAVDIFHLNNSILVNELQTIFGHKNSYLCRVNGRIGRYKYQDNKWIFEEGEFNQNESYDLRLKVAMELHKKTLISI